MKLVFLFLIGMSAAAMAQDTFVMSVSDFNLQGKVKSVVIDNELTPESGAKQEDLDIIVQKKVLRFDTLGNLSETYMITFGDDTISHARFRYNELGEQVWIKLRGDNEPIQEVFFSYNDEGQMIRAKTIMKFSEDDEEIVSVNVYSYNELGLLSERISFETEKAKKVHERIIYEYDSLQRLTSEKDFIKGKLLKEEWFEYTGDLKTRETKIVYSDYSEGNSETSTTYEYDEEGKLTFKRFHYQDREEENYFAYRYDEKGNLIEEVERRAYYPSMYGKEEKLTRYVYNENNQVVEEFFDVLLDFDDVQKARVVRSDRDEHGNFRKEVTALENKRTSVSTSTITYYD